jgi:hypothetical protein
MTAAVASAPERRRIQPILVPDDEAVPAQPSLVTVVAEAAPIEIPPVAPGRRIWVSLDDTYEFSYNKLLADRGIRVAGSAKRSKQAPQQLGDGRELMDGLKGDRGVHIEPSLACSHTKLASRYSGATCSSCTKTLPQHDCTAQHFNLLRTVSTLVLVQRRTYRTFRQSATTLLFVAAPHL